MTQYLMHHRVGHIQFIDVVRGSVILSEVLEHAIRHAISVSDRNLLMRLMNDALMMLFAHHRGNPYARATVPQVLVDMVYGGFFKGTLFYVLLWMQLAGEVETTAALLEPQRLKKARLNQLPANVA